MDDALSKIRPHVSSNLAHQKTPATLLVALESTLQEQKAESTPTAYFAALLTTLDGTIQKKDLALGDGDILPAELYLLALVAPFVPTPVIRGNLSSIISLTAPLFPSLNQAAPALRSQLSIYHALFQSLDRAQLESAGVRQPFASILQLCLDARPKVRRKAADVVKDILANPPSPMLRHPYADRVATWVTSALEEVGKTPLGRKNVEAPGAESAIHLLAFLRPVIKSLPPSTFSDITHLLLSLPRLGNSYLSQSAYSILSDLFSLSDSAFNEDDQIPTILHSILASPPSKFDATLSPPWVMVLGNAMLAYHAADPAACVVELARVWKTVWGFLESNDSATRKAVVHSVSLLSQCITPSMISEAGEKTTLGKILSQTSKSFDSLAFAKAVPDILAVVSALVTSVAEIGRRSPAAQALLLPLIKQVGALRSQKAFEFKEAADVTLGAAMGALGPHVLLHPDVLPLNLEPADRAAGHEPRAFLLPLLSTPHPSPLTHFTSYFVPLSERMFDLQQTADTEGRQAEGKVWAVLVAQVWSGLVGYCYGGVDLKEALSAQFCQLLSQLLYSQPELRPAVLKGLRILVDSNVAIAKSDQEPAPDAKPMPNPCQITSEQAQANVEFLRTQSESWLSVFFNVFGSVENAGNSNADARHVLGEVIKSWAGIAGKEEVTQGYQKVIELFKQSLGISGGNANSNLTATMEDLLILLLPYLSPADSTSLFQLCLSEAVLCAKEPTDRTRNQNNNGSGKENNAVQKRGYKILTKLIENGAVQVDAEATLKKLDELADGLAAAAKKDRFTLLAVLTPLIPASALHLVVSMIPEAVLGTKEPSDKARAAAFDVVLAMGRRMQKGGEEGSIIKRSMVDGMDVDEVPTDTPASIEEFMTMVSGGLAGASPHMISATVTAISRLVFEFKDAISMDMHNDIVLTLLVFLSSANREIVKSILGFVKLAIHTLPTDLIRPHLKVLVPALLGWSHDHKNHFKVKVRHIFERMLRRFGWNEVYGCAGDDDAAKVLTNIKKRKERAKRKKAEKADEDDDDDVPAAKPVTGDAFEDVLYGSESELGDSDDEDGRESNKVPQQSKKKAAGNVTRLRMDGDNPIDLLQGAASRLTNSNSNSRRKPGQDAARFKTDDETGKMIIDEDSDSEMVPDAAPTDVEGTAYREAITSVDGFTRGPNGRVKFNKDTKKRRRDEANDDGDVEMGDPEAADSGKNNANKRRKNPKLGHEFKAKKAGGDLKKGGVDPYAYLSLSQAAKKKGGKKGASIGVAKR
ncbi:armadillo-type protein [Mycena floridula]|nr:armadillo-type protein [Mycena floridula]